MPTSQPCRWPPTRLIWVLVLGIALFDVTMTLSADRAGGPAVQRGQDFMAFYSAGRMALSDQSWSMYDLPTLAALQRSIAAEAGFTMSADVAPWLNPPHVALLFAPLAATLPFKAALVAWTAFGVACLGATAWFLARVIGEASPLRRHRWLVAPLVFFAPPTLVALAHGQNTPLSLLLLTLTVVAWRAGRPLAAGLLCALLAYKPHLAAFVAIACFATLGRRVLIGLMIGGAGTLLATLVLLPGTLSAFATQMPGNVQTIFFEREFAWQRHATIAGFGRHLLHGNGAGATPAWVVALSATVVLALTAALVIVYWRALRPAIAHGDAAARDRLIACVILATPLLVPYFVDYDLSLLLIAGVLIARDAIVRPDASLATIWLRRVAMATYAWCVVNAIIAEMIGISLTTPLLVAVLLLQLRRVAQHDAERPVLAAASGPALRRAA